MNKGNITWNILNTILVGLVAFTIGLHSSYDNIQDQKIKDLEYRCEKLEYTLSCQPDTVVINVFNNITNKQ